MNSMLCPFTLTIVALFLPLLILFSIKKWTRFKPEPVKQLPPGPKKLPIIGNLHLISLPPFRSFRDLAKQYGPIMHLSLGQTPIILISSPELAKQILKDHDPIYADRPEGIAIKIMWYDYSDVAFCPYGDYWKQMRKICINELLSTKNVRSFASIRNDEVHRLVQSIHLSSGRPINLTEKAASLVASIVSRAAFGKVCKDKEKLIEVVMAGSRMGSGLEIGDLFPSSKILSGLIWWSKFRLWRMRRKLDVILDDIIDEHKKNLGGCNGEFGNEDLVDVFLRVKESGELQFPIGNDNIKAVLFDMFGGGINTSSTAIDWTMAELMKNPRVMAKAQTEVREVFKGRKAIEDSDICKLKYLKLVIREALRLHPPAPVIPRASREEHEINGFTIPAKVKVFVNNWAIQRDPNYWDNPESFEPERFENQNQSLNFMGGDFQYIPFGSGRRICPGMALGLANVELPLAQLLYDFNWKLPNGVKPEDMDMIENLGITAARKDNLFVVATPYEPLS